MTLPSNFAPAPIHVEAGLQLQEDAAWSWMRFPTITHELRSAASTGQVVGRVANLLGRLREGTYDLKILPRPYTAVAQRELKLAGQELPSWDPYNRQVARYLDRGGLRHREVYLGKLQGSRVKSRPLQMLGLAERAMGWTERPSAEELEKWRTKRDSLLTGASTGLPALRHAHASEIRWLLWRSYWRGLEQQEAAPPLGDRPASGDECMALINGHAEQRWNHVRLGDGGEACVAFLTMGHMPENKVYPGFDWLFHYEKLRFPVEAHVRFEIVPTQPAQSHLDKVENRAKDMIRHVREINAEVPDELHETARVARQERLKLGRTQGVMLKTWPRLAVYAPNQVELSRRVSILINSYEGLDIRLERPRGDQLALFFETLPGDRVRLPWHIQEMPPETLAGSLFFGSNDLGDPSGPYMGVALGRSEEQGTGKTGDSWIEGKPAVRMEPFLGSEISRAPAIAVLGETGGGKTTTVMKIVAESAMRGATAVVTDMKEDCDGLEALGFPNFQRIQLSEEYAGLLDPFGFEHRDPGSRGLLAAELCQRFLSPKLNDQAGWLVEGAASIEAKGTDGGSMRGLIQRIRAYNHELAIPVADGLDAVAGMPLASLCFGLPGQSRKPALQLEGKLTLIQFADLQIPDRSLTPERWSIRQRLAVGLMTAIAALCGHLIELGDDWRPKLLAVTEAWAMTASAEFGAMIERFSRLGRSKTAVVVIDTQNAKDVIDAGLANHIGQVFACRTNDPAAAREMTRLLPGADPDLVIRYLTNAESGECIYRDRMLRAGRLKVDLVFPGFREALDTRPSAKHRRALAQEAREARAASDQAAAAPVEVGGAGES